MTEGSVSSSGLDSTELSPEDFAWADSCLSKDPDISGSDWNSLKEALLETLSNTQDHFYPHESNDSPEESKMEISSVPGMGDTHNIDTTTDASIAATTNVAQTRDDDRLNHENTDDFWSSHRMEDVFLPTYNENLRDLGVSDPEFDLVFQAFESEQTNDDIFKIWDLDIPPEEDDLIKQLNKALAESSLEPTSSASDDTKAWKGLPDESLDDLIAGIAELALGSNSG